MSRRGGAPRCACARHADGSVTTFLCPVHADTDPCLTTALVTGRRRTGTIRRGVCTSCGHGATQRLCVRHLYLHGGRPARIVGEDECGVCQR